VTPAPGAEDGGHNGDMGKEAIIFFDKLGFGWVVDTSIVKSIKWGVLEEDEMPGRSLIKIIENILSEKQVL
jgi:hypothetical protein